jgi:hypothetical protein
MNKYFKITHGATTHYCCQWPAPLNDTIVVSDYGNGNYSKTPISTKLVDTLYTPEQRIDITEEEFNTISKKIK